MDDLLGLLVGFTDDALAHALRIDQRTLEHLAVRLIALQFPMQALVFRRQICDLLAELLRLRISLLQR